MRVIDEGMIREILPAEFEPLPGMPDGEAHAESVKRHPTSTAVAL